MEKEFKKVANINRKSGEIVSCYGYMFEIVN